MTNPVLVDILRGGYVESRHCGAAAVVDSDGRCVLAIGDIDRPIYPRSAVKPLQAIPLLESGAVAHYGFGDQELAIACASHSGEPGHVRVVERMLVQAGFDASALACGAQWPAGAAGYAVARAGGNASALHNNCSGKHAGFLCVAKAIGVDHRHYVCPDHPVQREIQAVLENMTGADLPPERRAIDGCSVPTWAMPLRNVALGFARLATGQGLSPLRADVVARIRAACAAEPWLVAGSGRLCTDIMRICGLRALVKTGAEGVYGAALPGEGLGIAVKCDDGATRAAGVMIAALISVYMPLDDSERVQFKRFVYPLLRNWNGVDVGAMRPTEMLPAMAP